MALFLPPRLTALIAATVLSVLAALPAAARTPNCTLTLDSAEALTEVLLRPVAEKAGLVICLAPGEYAPLDWGRLHGAFEGIPDARPMTITSANPARPAVLGRWQMSSRNGQPNGNLTLENLVIRVSSPEAGAGVRGYETFLFAVRIGAGAPTRNFTLRGVRIEGNMREARLGGERTVKSIEGVWGHGENVTIHSNTFTRIVNAISVWGDDIIILHNTGKHLWGDFIRLSAVPLQGGTCRPSNNMVVRNNIFSDSWSDNTEHPDVIHMFAQSNVPCGLHGVLIEGNIAFVGAEGMLQPGRPTGFYIAPPYPASAGLEANVERMHNLIAPGTVTLPRAACSPPGVKLGIQLAAGLGNGTITLKAAPGDRFNHFGEVMTEYTMRVPGEGWTFHCRGDGPVWYMVAEKTGPQGFFSNRIKGSDGYKDITVRHNVFWITSGHGLRLNDEDNENIRVTNNSFLQPYHGDANGDGRSNTVADGFNEYHHGARFLLDGRGVVVENNITAWLGDQKNRPGWRNNDDTLRHDDGGRAMRARFNWPRGSDAFFPTTAWEAIEMARPRADGPLAGTRLGAVGVTPRQDPYDWSWVPR